MENQDNQQNREFFLDDDWLDKILEESQDEKAVTLDESVIADADLDPATVADIDQIIEQTLTEIKSTAPENREASKDATQIIQKAPVKDQEYRDAFDEEEELEAIDEKIDELREEIAALQEEQDNPGEIFQYYIVDDNGARILEEFEEIVFYNDELDMYIWGVTHYGTAWDYVLTNIKIDLEAA